MHGLVPDSRIGAVVMDRRKFLKRVGLAALGSAAAGGVYPFLEAKWCRVARRTIALPNLPAPFRGATVALLADIHHGPFVPLGYIRHVVAMTNALRPDIVVLAGDYVHRSDDYIAPGIAELGKLTAAMGRFAVRGNHDNWESVPLSIAALAQAKVLDLNNTGVWLEQRGTRLRVCGVGDLWTDEQDLDAALGDATRNDAVILLSHNPDFVETLRDPRVGLVLSGHTHGGQVVVPGFGAPLVPSQYGQKYLSGLVQGPCAQVFVTRGVGTISPPVRFLCRPEVVLITLV
jgi:predicted MPP superfamily phosphohydrolase